MAYRCPACGGRLYFVRSIYCGVHICDIYKCEKCGRTWKIDRGPSGLRMAAAVAARKKIFGR